MKKVLEYLLVVSLILGGSAVGLFASTGDTCDDPFVIPSLPYWQETTTVDFNADYELGDGNACTGHTTSGKDVVYKYTVPDTLDTVCVTLSVIIPQDEGHYEFSISDCYVGELEKVRRISSNSLGLEVEPSITRDGAEISFTLAEEVWVRVRIMDIQGRVIREVLSSPLEAGLKKVSWNGRDINGNLLPPGVYFVSVVAGSKRAVARTILLK